MPVNFSHPPARTPRRAAPIWARAAGAAAAVALVAGAAAGPLLIAQPSQPSANAAAGAARCGELCNQPAASLPG